MDNNNFIFFYGNTPKDPAIIDKSCLSQFFSANDSPRMFDGFWWMGHHFKTTEHWMMVKKAHLFEDNEKAWIIQQSSNPAEAKKLGRMVSGFSQEIWDRNKLSIVIQGNLLKFSQNRYLSDYLLSTGDSILVEAAKNDPVWGIGMSIDDPGIKDPRNWNGENLLGKSLMHVRKILRMAMM